MIKIKNLCKKFENEVIQFEDITFEDDKSYVILGPSGCGKSTLLNLISGNLRSDGGEIQVIVDNKNYSLEKLNSNELKSYRRDNISYVSQEFKLFEKFSVYDNLKIIEEIKASKVSIKKVADSVGLNNKLKQKVRTLSGGEKQRVLIARALLQEGKVVLCDEPTGSLNEALAKEIIRLLINLQKNNNSTLIVVTHDERLIDDFDVVIRYSDFIKMNIGGDN